MFIGLRVLLLALLVFPCAKAGETFDHEFETVQYLVYRAAPAEVELHWKDEHGVQYRNFSVLQKALRAKGREPVLFMNAGIFDPGGIPSGLHVEGGKEIRPLNQKDAPGNFYLKPNGVFLVDDQGKAAILESAEFAAAPLKPKIALQSGPLLLRQGKIHPAFRRESKNLLRRNGVGVDSKGRVVLVMTAKRDQRVNLHGFARLFRDSLDCPDALFLDGDISLMEVGPMEDLKPVNSFAAILAVTVEAEKKEAPKK